MMLDKINGDQTLGQIAFEAYVAQRPLRFDGKPMAYDGTPIPTWGQLRPEISAAWEEAGKAVALAVGVQYE
jgi:hypothetical protein